MDSDIDNRNFTQITIQINPYLDRLEKLGLGLDELEDAISISLGTYFHMAEAAEATDSLESVSSIYESEVRVCTAEFKLSELAEIRWCPLQLV